MSKHDLWPFMAAITLSVSASGLLTSWLLMKNLEPIQDKLALSTPIAVMDFGQAVLSLGPNASEQEIEARLLQTNEHIARLKAAGFIVLDAQAVVGADESVYVPVGSEEVKDGLHP